MTRRWFPIHKTSALIWATLTAFGVIFWLLVVFVPLCVIGAACGLADEMNEHVYLGDLGQAGRDEPKE